MGFGRNRLYDWTKRTVVLLLAIYFIIIGWKIQFCVATHKPLCSKVCWDDPNIVKPSDVSIKIGLLAKFTASPFAASDVISFVVQVWESVSAMKEDGALVTNL